MCERDIRDFIKKIKLIWIGFFGWGQTFGPDFIFIANSSSEVNFKTVTGAVCVCVGSMRKPSERAS